MDTYYTRLLQYIAPSHCRHLCSPHPRPTDCKPLPLPCSSYIIRLALFCTAVTPLLATALRTLKVPAVVQPLPPLPLSAYRRRHQRTLANSATLRISSPTLRLTARYPSAITPSNRSTTRRQPATIQHVLRHVSYRLVARSPLFFLQTPVTTQSDTRSHVEDLKDAPISARLVVW